MSADSDPSAPQLTDEFDAHLPDLLEAAPDAMVVVGRDGRIVRVNGEAERLFGYGRGELVGSAVEALVPAAFRSRHVGNRDGFFRDPRRRPMGAGIALRGRRKDGSEFPAEISLGPVHAPDDLWVVAAVRDASERRREEAKLQAANRDLEAFSYTVAHDLRAPLRAIDGFAMILDEDHRAQLDEDARRCLDRIQGAAQRMAQLIEGLLSLARVARDELELQPVDLSALATTVAERLADAQPTRGVEIVVEPGLMAAGDPRLLTIVVDNLLENAWKFTRDEPNPRVEFSALPPASNQVFYVRDNGAGFDMTYADKLFGVFERLHTEQEFAGTGIGLATVRRIVERHGGRAWAEGAVGEGATIYFTLVEDSE